MWDDFELFPEDYARESFAAWAGPPTFDSPSSLPALVPDSPSSSYQSSLAFSPLEEVRRGLYDVRIQSSLFAPPSASLYHPTGLGGLDASAFPHHGFPLVKEHELVRRPSHPFSVPHNAVTWESNVSTPIEGRSSAESSTDEEGKPGRAERSWIRAWQEELRRKGALESGPSDESHASLSGSSSVAKTRSLSSTHAIDIPARTRRESLLFGDAPISIRRTVKKRSPDSDDSDFADGGDAGYSPPDTSSPYRPSSLPDSAIASTSQSVSESAALAKSPRRHQAVNKPRRRRKTLPSTTNDPTGLLCGCTETDGSLCTVVFKRQYDLARHQETIHGQVRKEKGILDAQGQLAKDKGVGEPKKKSEWGCSGCGGFFSRKDALIRHRRIRGCE